MERGRERREARRLLAYKEHQPHLGTMLSTHPVTPGVCMEFGEGPLECPSPACQSAPSLLGS